MRNRFDVGVESLAGGGNAAQRGARQAPLPLPLRGAPKGEGAGSPDAAVAGKSFFIETFGCQMNDHDSEKVAGVLQGRGYRPVPTPLQADLVLYNTCSIREKAAQKVFARPGGWAAWRSRKARRFSNARRGSAWCAARPATANCLN